MEAIFNTFSFLEILFEFNLNAMYTKLDGMEAIFNTISFLELLV